MTPLTNYLVALTNDVTRSHQKKISCVRFQDLIWDRVFFLLFLTRALRKTNTKGKKNPKSRGMWGWGKKKKNLSFELSGEDLNFKKVSSGAEDGRRVLTSNHEEQNLFNFDRPFEPSYTSFKFILLLFPPSFQSPMRVTGWKIILENVLQRPIVYLETLCLPLRKFCNFHQIRNSKII